MVLDSAMPLWQRLSDSWPALAGAVLLAGTTSGCTPDCGEEQTIRYEQGSTDPTHTVYQSTPITGPWLHFPAGRTYELLHDLRADPVDVDISLAFKESGENLAPSSGNQSVYNVDSPKRLIKVKNDTCAEFYVYVVAIAAPAPNAGDADAGSD